MIKKITIMIGIAFLAAMVGFTVWSRSIYQNGLPVVKLDLPQADSFTFSFKGYGAAAVGGADGEVKIHIPKEEIKGDFPFYRDDSVDLTFPNERNATKQQGKIRSITDTKDGVDVLVGFSPQNTQNGDSVVVEMKKQSKELSNVLPQAALYSDPAPYVWLVKETKGAWGPEYVAEKAYVSVLLDDGEKFATGSAVDKPVVVDASAPLQEGQAVRFYP